MGFKVAHTTSKRQLHKVAGLLNTPLTWPSIFKVQMILGGSFTKKN
jgi:hypothetical protein